MESEQKNLVNDYKKIIIEDIPLIDLRAPIEYVKGAFPNSVNLPLMSDDERKVVGTTYKQEGHDEAVKLGYELVSGKIKEERLQKWVNFIKDNPKTILYCFRGGMRSKITQGWINEVMEADVPRLEGGYKAFRNYLIDELQEGAQTSTPILLGGYSGGGKTILLNKLENSIDLEGIANHHGSSFGRNLSDQPTQIDFENRLAYEIIKKRAKNYKYLVFEDEGKHIGRCYLPKSFLSYLDNAALVILESKLEERIEIIFDEYVTVSQLKYTEAFGKNDGLEKWFEKMNESIDRIKKKLGRERYSRIKDVLNVAFFMQKGSGSLTMHRDWIKILLEEYYDPMYKYQMEKTENKIIFKGNEREVLDYFKSLV